MEIRGFSSIGRNTGTKNLSDKELAIRDLLNHFHTRKGERVNEPNFGCNIPLRLFQQFDDFEVDLIEDDILEVINADQRWQYINHEILEEENGITINLDVVYVPKKSVVENIKLVYTTGEEAGGKTQ